MVVSVKPQHYEPSPKGQVVLFLFTLAIVLGAAFLQGYTVAGGREDEMIVAVGKSRCDGAVESIKFAIQETRFLTQSTAAFFTARNFDVTRAEFRAIYGGKHFEDVPVLQAIEWIPSVETEIERDQLEREGQQFTNGELPSALNPTGQTGTHPLGTDHDYHGWDYSFHQTINDARHTDSPKNSAPYYPVHYVEPLAGNEAALGFNLASSKARLDAITEAITSEAPVASSRITLVQSVVPQYGFLYFEPMADGLILAVFKADKLLTEILKYYALPNMKIGLFDVTSQQEDYLAHYFQGESPSQRFNDYKTDDIETWASKAVGPKNEREADKRYDLRVGARNWRVVCSFGGEYLDGERSNIGIVMFFVCLGVVVTHRILGKVALWFLLDVMRGGFVQEAKTAVGGTEPCGSVEPPAPSTDTV